MNLKYDFYCRHYYQILNLFTVRNMTKLESLKIENAKIKSITSDHLNGLEGLGRINHIFLHLFTEIVCCPLREEILDYKL